MSVNTSLRTLTNVVILNFSSIEFQKQQTKSSGNLKLLNSQDIVLKQSIVTQEFFFEIYEQITHNTTKKNSLREKLFNLSKPTINLNNWNQTVPFDEEMLLISFEKDPLVGIPLDINNATELIKHASSEIFGTTLHKKTHFLLNSELTKSVTLIVPYAILNFATNDFLKQNTHTQTPETQIVLLKVKTILLSLLYATFPSSNPVKIIIILCKDTKKGIQATKQTKINRFYESMNITPRNINIVDCGKKDLFTPEFYTTIDKLTFNG